MLFVEHDHPEIAHRCKDRRAGADRDPALAAVEGTPRVGALAIGEAAVQHGDLVTEHAAHPRDRLWGQGDLGDKDQRTAPGLERSPDVLEIHQRFSGAGDAEEQRRFADRGGGEPRQCLALRRREVGRRSAHGQRGKRVACALFGLEGNQTGPDQPPERCFGGADCREQVTHGSAPPALFQGLVEQSLLGCAPEPLVALEQGEGISCQRSRAHRGDAAGGIRCPHLDLHCTDPLQSVGDLPYRSLERAGCGAGSRPPATLSQKGEQCPCGSADLRRMRIGQHQFEGGLTPERRRQHRAEHQPDRGAVVAPHLTRQRQQRGRNRRRGIGCGQQVARDHGRHGNVDRRDDADHFLAPDRNDNARPGERAVGESGRNPVGVRLGQWQRQRDARIPLGHRRVTPRPGASGRAT